MIIRPVTLPREIAECRLSASDVPRIRVWIDRTRALAADGLVRPDIGEIAEIFVAVHLDGDRARRGEPSWDVRTADGDRYVQVKAVWHLPHRRRQYLGTIAQAFTGEIWVVEFAQDLAVQSVWQLPAAEFAGQRLRVRDAAGGTPVQGWQDAAARLGLLAHATG